jgi:CRISPR-associated endonuclease Csn1
MQSKQNLGQLTFGFDIGIASVGWAVLAETRIVDLGVRAFDKAETAKEGESLNLARRTARLMRRRLRRRAWRLTKVARLLKKYGVVNDVALFSPEHPFATSIWELRKQGLDRLLNAEEWARVIYHLCKHRGFHWVSKAEKLKDDDSAGETGKVKKGLAVTNKLMKDKGYRTAAEMVLAEFPQAQRNKQGEYSKALERELLSFEFATLFKLQRAFNNPHTSAELETKLLDRKTGLFWAQKPSLSGDALLKMLGKCTFEKSEYRAPKASFTAERHVWLTRLNNLRIVVDGETRQLNDAERQIALPMPYNQASEFTYKQLKTALVKEGLLPETVKFAGFSYPAQVEKEDSKPKDPEAETLIKIPAFQELRNTLKKAGLETEWQGMVNAAMAGDTGLLDQIAWVLSIYKEDDEVELELNKLNLPNKAKMVEALLGVRFDKFSNLSLKALCKIVPHMLQGLRYDEACIEAGYHHSQLVKADDKKLHYLPPFYSARDKTGKLIFNENLDIPRNPVVLRALNQARKVMNALIKKYGAPQQVNIEMARDLSRPFDERRKIKDLQEEFRAKNEKDRATFNVEFNTTGELKGKDFEKYQLYREQQGKCAYSIEPIDLNNLFDLGYV